MNRIEEKQFIQKTYRQPYARKLAEEIGVGQYDDFVWKLTRRFTNSNEEAAAAVDQMLTDIRLCVEGGERISPIETRLTTRLAFRRLLKFLQ